MKYYTYIFIAFFCLTRISAQAQDEHPFTQFIGEDCHLGLLDAEQKELLPAKYAEIKIRTIGNDWLISALAKSHYSYFLYKQKHLIPLQYPELELINNRLMKVGEKGAYGLVNTDGQGVLVMNYNEILPAGPNAAIIIREGAYGVVDLEGKVIIPESYKNIQHWEMGGFWVEQGGQWRLYTPEGKKIEKAYYADVFAPWPDLPICAVQSDDKWGLIGPNNKVIIPIENSTIQLFEGGTVGVQDNKNKWYLHDLKGKRLLKESFEAVSEFERSGVIVHKKGKKGLLDNEGKVLLPIEFDDIRALGNAWAAVKNEEGCRIFDCKNLRFLEHEFEAVQSGPNWAGILFQKDKKWGWLDYDNNIRIQPTYSSATPQGSNCILVQGENRKLGTLDTKGTMILPIEYTIITPKNKFFKVQKEGGTGWFYVNEQNEEMNCQLFR